ncbi:MAG: hypothetical protein KDD36_12965 [Flavobacteriales bacterium]|nr:hypothetical protein [Flavobacteriales bacterium]
MKNVVLIIATLLFTSGLCEAQDVFDKMSKKICKCIEKEKVVNVDDILPCVEKTMFENMSAIIDYYQVTSISEVKGEAVGQKIALKLAKNCEYFYSLMRDSIQVRAPKFSRDSILNCDGIQTGDYFYVIPDKDGNLTDTTFVTFTETEYLERMNHGRTYSKLTVKWSDKCHFTLTFAESNDPYKSALSKVGDKYEYEVIQNNSESMVLKCFFHNDEYFVECFKVR